MVAKKKNITVKVFASGTKFWYRNDLYHREDGPAIECADGAKFWYLNGKKLSETEFNNRLAPKHSKKKFATFFVGRKEPGNFVRHIEETDGDEFEYEVFTHYSSNKNVAGFSAKKEQLLRKKYNLVIGPFATVRASEIFRDREGVNSVSEAEELAK